ncbi:MAG: MarR family transcriptional regulator [Pseudomonadota bacterium]
MSTKTIVTREIEIGQLVDRFMRQMHRELSERGPKYDTAKVGPAGGMVLMTLADVEPVPIHELVRLIARDKAQITRLLQSLGAKGLIERSQSTQDGRVCILQLSSDGRAAVDGLRQALADTISHVLSPLSERERDIFKELLIKTTGTQNAD